MLVVYGVENHEEDVTIETEVTTSIIGQQGCRCLGAMRECNDHERNRGKYQHIPTAKSSWGDEMLLD